MTPLNLFRKDGDRKVWERVDRDAKAAGTSISGYVVAVLREHQERADRASQDVWNRYPAGADGEVTA